MPEEQQGFNPNSEVQTEIRPLETPQEDGHWDEEKARAIGFAINKVGDNTTGSTELQLAAGDLMTLRGQQADADERLDLIGSQRLTYLEEYGREGRFAQKGEAYFDKAQAPFEKLYDVNPEYFNNLPTSEFIEAAKKMEKIERSTGSLETDVRLLDNKIQDLEKITNNEKALKVLLTDGMPSNWSNSEFGASPFELKDVFEGAGAFVNEDNTTSGSVFMKATNEYLTVLGLMGHGTTISGRPSLPSQYMDSQPVRTVLYKGMAEISKNAVDMTPRQKWEIHKKTLQEVVDMLKTKQGEMDEQRVTFLKQYSPDTNHGNVPSEQPIE